MKGRVEVGRAFLFIAESALSLHSRGLCLIGLSSQVQYVEVYNERVNDLLAALHPDQARPSISDRLVLRERSNGEVFIDGAAEMQVRRREELASLLEHGGAMRTIASHL